MNDLHPQTAPAIVTGILAAVLSTLLVMAVGVVDAVQMVAVAATGLAPFIT